MIENVIKKCKSEIMRLLNMKKWGVIDLTKCDSEIKTKVASLLDDIDFLNFALYKLKKIKKELGIK